MVELRAIVLKVLPAIVRAAALDVDLLLRVLSDDTLRALKQDVATVRTRRIGVVRDRDRLPLLRSDERGDDVTERVVPSSLDAVRPDMFRGPEVQPSRLAGHRNEVVELVAAIDVHPLCDRADAVRRIEIAVATNRVLHAPPTNVEVAELQPTEVVQVATLGMQDRKSVV